jgi:tripartite-type tricarboxylate transporter receptor subunit TctC
MWNRTSAVTCPRRGFLQLAAGAAAAAAWPRAAGAEVYPSRTVRIITPFGSAGAPDIITRLLAQWLTERLGQSFVVEIRAGGAGQIGTEAVVRSAPDGYTLLVIAPSHVINATLYDNKLSYNFLRDITPVASMISSPNVLVVNPSLPVNSVPELIAYAKANPGKLNMGSVGIGGNPHVAGELFKIMSGIDMVHVPYRSAAAVLTDLLAGQVQVYFASSLSSKEYIKNGQLRPLAITAATRTDLVPGVPALAEFLPGYEASAWFGLGAPANTPVEIIDKLNAEINRALADPKILASLDRLGAMPMVGTPARFGTLLAQEQDKWAKVIRAANIKPE